MPNMDAETLVLLVINVILFVFGSIFNTSIIIYYGFKREHPLLFHIYLLNLAATDMITCIITPSHFVYDLVASYTWNLGEAACKIASIMGPWTVNVSSWVLTAIAFERFHGLTKPLHYRPSRKQIHILNAVIWVLSFTATLPNLIATEVTEINFTPPNSTQEEKREKVCRPNHNDAKLEFGYAVATMLLQSVIPISCMFVAFCNIYKSMINSEEDLVSLKDADSNMTSVTTTVIERLKCKKQTTFKEKRAKRLAKILGVTFSVFIVCSLPYNVFYVVAMYMIRLEHNTSVGFFRYLNTWLAQLVVSNSCMNFFIYSGLDPAFKRYIKSLLGPLCKNQLSKRTPRLSTADMPLTEVPSLERMSYRGEPQI